MALSKIRNDSLADTAVHGRRNILINGAMTVDQRNATTTSEGFTVDRWNVDNANFGEMVMAVTQDTASPADFSHSLKVAVTTAETDLGANHLLRLRYTVEAQDIQHLNYGTSSAKKLTLSFWVRSSLTGKYSVMFYQPDATRSNLQSYNISTADTWEYKTITIDGDTGGTINNDTGGGFQIYMTLAAGTNYTGTPHTGWGAYVGTDDFAHSDMVDFTAQTGEFYLTGVQLEVGDKASPFEHRSYSDELLACQRYCHVWKSTQAYDPVCMMTIWSGNESIYGTYSYPVEMRADPTVTYSGSFGVATNGTTITGGTPSTNRIGRYVTNTRYDKSGHGQSQANSGWLRDNNDSDATVTFDAEL